MVRERSTKMNRVTKTLALSVVALAFLACESRTDKTDGGGVLLSISSFDALPTSVSISTVGESLRIPTLVVQNIVKNPNGPTSDLMNVEIQYFEVSFTRNDTGTRVPDKLVEPRPAVVPVNGEFTYANLPVMRLSQLDSPPLKDLATVGFDRETGSTAVVMNLWLRFYGRTLSGDPVDTGPGRGFTIQFVP
jgi:hypothetical protein